jgi:hypothetical protein
LTDPIELPHPSPDVRGALDDAMDQTGEGHQIALRAVVAQDPLCLEGWARLGEAAYESGDDVAAYAFFRVGYHRGLDLLRSVGWRPDAEVTWAQESNRGFLLSLAGLMRAAAAIGEGVEARRCREFLLQLDPEDHLDVMRIAPKDLSRRL